MPVTQISSDQRVWYFLERSFSELERKRVVALENLELDRLLQTSNPYFFAREAEDTTPDIISTLIAIHLNSQEKTIFGDFLEALAHHVCKIARGGKASGIEGVDLEFDDGDTLYLISLESSANSNYLNQIRQTQTDSRKAYQSLSQRRSDLRVQAVNGFFYGQTSNTFDHEEYWKLSGQRFWELISDETDFYTRIIEPLAMRAKTRNEEFSKVYGRTINRLLVEFIERFVRPDFHIDWPALVKFNSESAARSDQS